MTEADVVAAAQMWPCRCGSYREGVTDPLGRVHGPGECEVGQGLVTCQGCGAVRAGSWLGKAHACWRNEDGSYEEGGTFQ